MVTVRDQWAAFPLNQPLIATTRDFDWAVINSMVASDRGRRKKSIVIVDSTCHNKTEPPNPVPPYLGNTYTLWPASGIRGTFHPKIAVALEDDNLMLLVGSHNLTRNGVDYNLEIKSVEDSIN
jgi:hypothetical protein